MDSQYLKERLISTREKEAKTETDRLQKEAEDREAAKAAADYCREHVALCDRAERLLERQGIDQVQGGGDKREFTSKDIFLANIEDEAISAGRGSTSLYAQIMVGKQLERVEGRKWLRKTVGYTESFTSYFGIRIVAHSENGTAITETGLFSRTSRGVDSSRELLKENNTAGLAWQHDRLLADIPALKEIRAAIDYIEGCMGESTETTASEEPQTGSPST